MQAKKRVLIISLIAAFLGMVIFTIAVARKRCYADSKVIEWIKTVSSGVLTSALVTFFAYIGEYRVEKIKAFKEFYEAADALTNQYRGLKTIYTEIPIDLLKAYFHAVMLQSPFDPEPIGKPKQDIVEFLWMKLPESAREKMMEDGNAEEYKEQRFRTALERDRAVINNVISQYLNLANNIGTKHLTSAYGNIDLIIDYKKIRQNLLYDKIYKKHVDMQHKIHDLVYHLREFVETEEKNPNRGNMPVVITKIADVEKCLFEEKHHWYNMETAMFKHFVYEMDCQSHELLKYVYGKGYRDPKPDEKRYCAWWRYENAEDYKNDEEEEV